MFLLPCAMCVCVGVQKGAASSLLQPLNHTYERETRPNIRTICIYVIMVQHAVATFLLRRMAHAVLLL